MKSVINQLFTKWRAVEGGVVLMVHFFVSSNLKNLAFLYPTVHKNHINKARIKKIMTAPPGTDICHQTLHKVGCSIHHKPLLLNDIR